MDLGINGKTALVCASSNGLGKACATSLAKEGVHVFINGRTLETLEAAAEEIRAAGGEVTIVQADVSTDEGRKTLIEACPNPDILINNNAGPDPIGFAQSNRENWDEAIDANMMAPILMIQAVLPGMRERKFGRIINITSAMVKSPSPVMCVSAATRSAVTALSKAVSKEVVADNVTINNMLPEMFDTGRQKQNAELIMLFTNASLEEAREKLVSRITAGRFGQPKEFGDTCAFLCSHQASYISGQNIQLDGGSYDGLV
ncbi:SDR family oxidoreductase [Oceanicoccus sagamiensis]|uniref:3-oxoacyl-ACP reductase n=1 Tax=Oceanicoccus sagamiensis TaxID=716816 RepID=A0A1X9NBK8_9GAMM|nr:SDR family oxidoreductase [Oceanicoccus sagamiensis]ARN74551.1 3-oxoacyl-ACP reductase [Oceanicoccus sagamiensis]